MGSARVPAGSGVRPGPRHSQTMGQLPGLGALVALVLVGAGSAGCFDDDDEAHRSPHGWRAALAGDVGTSEIDADVDGSEAPSAKAASEGPEAAKGDRDEHAVLVPPPPFSEEIFPCTKCHDPEDPDDVRRRVRVLDDEHEAIALRHGEKGQWCYSCHNPPDRDVLRLSGDKTVSFEQSYLLCGQCHGPKLRDWRAGVHGKRTGSWSGDKEYRLCVHCHDPHAPAFPPMAPKPRPLRPAEIRPSP